MTKLDENATAKESDRIDKVWQNSAELAEFNTPGKYSIALA